MATDNAGMTSTSPIVSVTVNPANNNPPSVSITSPSASASFTAPASISIAASASDSDGTVAVVDFYQGTTLIGSDATSPYSMSWSNVAAGQYQLTARAKDDDGATRTSTAISVTVNPGSNKPPSVSISSPASGSTFTTSASIAIQASASDSDGSVARVDFYRGSTLIGSDVTSPYSSTWTSPSVGSHVITAKATDDDGATTSAAVNVTVNTAPNQPPTVSILSPVSGTVFTAPASITISATAADSGGTISKVDFYAGSQFIGTDTTSPYSASWTNVGAGSYALSAVAWDNGGATGTSIAVSVTVTAAVPKPTTVVFVPSVDHATTVTSYSVALRRASDPVTANPVATLNLGKPSILSGEISVNISSIVDPLPAGSVLRGRERNRSRRHVGERAVAGVHEVMRGYARASDRHGHKEVRAALAILQHAPRWTSRHRVYARCDDLRECAAWTHVRAEASTKAGTQAGASPGQVSRVARDGIEDEG